jgi:hypothetical protein
MSLFESIPKLDLTPRFDAQPFSPARAGDYWRLFKDIFYFPQRLRDYVQDFARQEKGEQSPPASWHWSDWSEWFGNNPFQSGLFRLAALFVLLLLLLVVGLFGLLVAAFFGHGPPMTSIVVSFVIGLAVTLVMLGFGLRSDNLGAMVAVASPLGVTLTFWLLAALTPKTGPWTWAPWEAALLTFACGASFGVVLSIAFAITNRGLAGAAVIATFAAAIGLLLGLTVFYVAENLLAALLGGAGALVGCVLGVFRPDDWALGALRMGVMGGKTNWENVAHVTPLAFGSLSLDLRTWLEFNWKAGLGNATILWRYSGQHGQIRQAIHEILAEAKDDSLLEKVAYAADAGEGALWGMIMYDNPLRSEKPPKAGGKAQEKGKIDPKAQRQAARQRLRAQGRLPRRPPSLPTGSPAQAVVAGFWYLAHGFPAAGRDAFKKGPSSPLGKEMIALADALTALQSEENLLANSGFKFVRRPDEAKRKASWEMLDKVRDMALAARLQRQCLSDEKRQSAAAIAGRLRSELAGQTELPHVEMRVIQTMAVGWEAGLNSWLESSEKQPLKPIVNPFIFAEPLREKRLHVNRDAELTALKEAWAVGNLQTVIIYGQPLVGKTSLLYNAEIANRATVQLAWFRLGHLLTDHAPLHQVLNDICKAARDATMLEVTVFRGDDAFIMPDIETAVDPYSACEDFIRRTCRLIEPHNLILVLDGYDALEGAFASTEEHDRFLGFLWHLYQGVRNFNVAFVSQRSPILFFQTRISNPFASTARALVVRNLDKEACRKLLRSPAEDFALRFSDDAIDAIFTLTGGHPYFIQLIAYRLVQRFNLLAQKKEGEPLIERGDVNAIVGGPGIRGDDEYLQRSRQFFTAMGLLTGQVGADVTTLLQLIADDYPDTQTADLVKKLTPTPIADERILDNLLIRLQRYGVIEQEADSGAWRFQIELWRRYVTQRRPQLTTTASAQPRLQDNPQRI